MNALQEGFAVSAGSSEPFILPNYDPDSYEETFDALTVLGRGLTELSGMGGSKQDWLRPQAAPGTPNAAPIG